jgi:hypothetical protein
MVQAARRRRRARRTNPRARRVAQSALPAGVVLGAGGTAGVLYWLAIFPVDVIKSAIMTDSIDPKHRKYPNIISTAKARAGHSADGPCYACRSRRRG